MPDLSNLLGAVYGEGPTSPSGDADDEAPVRREPPAEERGPAVPDWADDEHLDAAFAQWKPGPSDDASAVERAVISQAHDDPPPPLPDDLAAALSAALVATSDRGDDDQPVSAADHASDTADPGNDTIGTSADHALQTDAMDTHAIDTDAMDTAVVDADVDTHAMDADVSDAVALSPLSPLRAAAAELTAASRVDPEPAAAFAPPPAPEPAPVAVVPAAPAVAPELGAAPALDPATEVPPGARRWDRSDDDILPEKRSRGFFSFSLRRG
jgi:hypothetical protein